MAGRSVRTYEALVASVAVVALLAAGCSSSGGGSAPASGGSSAAPGSSSAPGSSAASSSSSSGSTSLTVSASVQRKQGNVLVFVPVQVGGKKSMFVLDSGAAITLLDAGFAKSAGLKTAPVPGRTKTLGCTKKPTVTTVTDWRLGGRPLAPARLPVQSLGLGSAKVRGLPIGGLLGADAQSATKVVTIDYAGGKVTFGAQVPTGGTSVDIKVLRLQAGVAVEAPVTLAGKSFQMLVDTGASRTSLGDRTVAQLRLKKAGPAVQVNAAGCPARAQPVRLTGAKLGSRALPASVVSGTEQATPSVPSAVGLFGSDLLATFRTVTIDYTGSRLILGG